MDYENHDICEKIIDGIDAIFNKDPNLSTFEIISVDESQTKNKTPVIHVENHLGLESWCCPIVYRHAHQIILAAAKKYPHHSMISHEVNGSDHTPHPFNHTLVKYLNCALLINPDVTTFWNARRRLLQKDRLDIGREFKFSAIVLSKKPKSNDAFCYRRWLYSFQSHESIDWTRELSLCERCASKSLSNYQAWSHRQWVLQKSPFLLQYELQTSERFIRKHIGDYSVYSHRQFVLYKMDELKYFELESSNEFNITQYAALINYLASIGSSDANTIRNQMSTSNIDYKHTPAWKILIRIITPERDCNDKIRIKSFLYCMNVAAYDLKFINELKEMFGYREAFECHRRAVNRFLASKCIEWSVASFIMDAVCTENIRK
ncbi:protein prenyltransferase alpha subunit repeat-containing protein 1-B [Contarinia nasturtii]|uniref:protein prenyltransferase alpha subunit repeat-containing protein 1-B n=1 Tax=Contarinia nasturtii TaxID=265458 RepID=UPI0012D46399|nr:protein prenyltransferase alpha subunit repeat-containing protein 1-B [Contarinia nasturtii]